MLFSHYRLAEVARSALGGRISNDLSPDVEITGTGPVRAFVVSSREDLEIAHAVRDVVGRR